VTKGRDKRRKETTEEKREKWKEKEVSAQERAKTHRRLLETKNGKPRPDPEKFRKKWTEKKKGGKGTTCKEGRERADDKKNPSIQKRGSPGFPASNGKAR